MGIPALDRGLDILDAVISSIYPMKYSELKNTIPGISDSSLNRLLASLVDKNIIRKNTDGRYMSADLLERWSRCFTGQQNIAEMINISVENTVDKTNESAAFAQFSGDRIEILSSISAENSISIIPTGNTLYFEEDHAASLAIIDALPEEERIKCLNGKFSRIANRTEWKSGTSKFFRKEKDFIYYIDESEIRKGISRLAVPLTVEKRPCALFICAPVVRMEKQALLFLSVLRNEIKKLEQLK